MSVPAPAPQLPGPLEGQGSEPLFWVGIGSSAGGLEALQKLVRKLPQKNNATYIVVQHLSPRHKSLLATLIKRETKLEVLEVENGIRPKPNTVYVTPPNSDVVVKDEQLWLQPPSPELAASKPSVDRFFLSLADEMKSHAVGLILSGTGSDGSFGVQAIRAAGGITIAQDLQSAKYDGMPGAAINSGCIDLVLSVTDIGIHLDRILSDPKLFARSIQPTERLEGVGELIGMLGERFGVDFSDYKIATLQRRVERRISALGLSGVEEYASHVRRNSRELENLFREMLISVTSFFRDQKEFENLAPFIKQLVEERESRRLRFWVAGCATGEEVYSLAILVANALGGPGNLDSSKIQIFATDIDSDALQIARRGLYAAASLDGVPREIIETYFRPEEGGYSVIPALKDITLFSRHNVCQDPPFLNIDIVSCRNVLIYFNNALQSRVLSRLHYALAPNGLVFLGNSEGVTGTEELFRAVASQAKIFRKRVYSSIEKPLTVPTMPRAMRSERPLRQRDKESRAIAQAQAKFDALSRAIAPKSIVVSGDMRIVSVYGDVTPYLELAENRAPQLSLSLLRKPLAQEARALIALALRNGARRDGRVWQAEGDENLRYQLSAYPIASGDDDDDIIGLVGFSEWIDLDRAVPTGEGPSEDAQREIDELQREVASVREALQQSVEELETTNDELQSLNEELQSANEELQSTNEELETSNEELQSTNEELVTVNQEQMEISRELSKITEEFGSILANIGVPVIVVNIALQVIRASDVAKTLFDMKSLQDEPHISHFKMPAGVPNLAEAFHKVLTEGVASELKLDVPGEDLIVRLSPFFDSRGRLTGATAVFVGQDFENLRAA